MTASAFPAASDGTPNPAASVATTVARWQEDVAQGMVTLVTAQGATWQILPDPQVTKWATNGTVTQTTDRSGQSTTWHPDGSQTSVSAAGLTTTTAADKTRTLTTATGAALTIAPTGSVASAGVSSSADGSYDLGGGTNVASNGVITITLDDGSTLMEQTNGVVTLHAQDGTETTWTPPGASTNYPNGYVSRTHADGSSEGWYTADDKNPEALYVRLAAPKAPTNTHVYGSGLGMVVETNTISAPLAVDYHTPNGAVLTSLNPSRWTTSDWVTAGVVTHPLTFNESRSDYANQQVTPGVYTKGTPGARTAGAATKAAILPIKLFPPYHLSDPQGPAWAQVAATGKKFAVGASLEHPETLWVGNTIEEQPVQVTVRVAYTLDYWGWETVEVDGKSYYVRVPRTYSTHYIAGYTDSWNYIIDGVTHHSATRLNVYALTPPAAAQKYVATFYQDPGRTDPNDFTSDDEQQVIHYDKMDHEPTMQLNQYTGLPEYTFTLDGVDYISDGIPPDISMDVSKTALPPVPENPWTTAVAATTPNMPTMVSVNNAGGLVAAAPGAGAYDPVAQVEGEAALAAMSLIFKIRGTRLQGTAQNVLLNYQDDGSGATTLKPSSPGGSIKVFIGKGALHEPENGLALYYDLKNPAFKHWVPVYGLAKLMHELEHARHIQDLHLTEKTFMASKTWLNSPYDVPVQIADQYGAVDLSNINPILDPRYDKTLFDLFSEYIGYRGEYTTLNFILNNYNHNPPGNLKSLDNNILKDIANLQWNMNAAQDAQQALGAALRRYLDYFGNAANVKAAKFYGQDVYDRFKTYTNYFFDKENMRGSHVPRPTTPDHD